MMIQQMSPKKIWLDDGSEYVTPCRGHIAPDTEFEKGEKYV